MKFCYDTNFTLPKQFQRSRSILYDGSRSLELFWKEKSSVLYLKKYDSQETVDPEVATPSGSVLLTNSTIFIYGAGRIKIK